MINYSIVIRGTKPGTKTEDITETKAYGVAQISENLTINEFAKHIAEHGTLYSRDVIQGVLIKHVLSRYQGDAETIERDIINYFQKLAENEFITILKE